MNNNKIDKLNKFSTFKNINFKHSNYGIVKSGVYKGLQIEIREYIPEKIEVRMDNKVILTTRDSLRGKKYTILNIVPSRITGVLNNFRSVVLNSDNIFYRDVLLKKIGNDNVNHYASVKKITQKGLNNDYYIKGEIFKDKKYIEIEFRYSDILEMLSTFKINESYKSRENDIDIEMMQYSDVESDTYDTESDTKSDTYDSDESDTFSDSDEIDIEHDSDIEDDSEDIIMQPSVSYKSRTGTISENEVKKDDYIVLKFIEHIFLSIMYKGVISSKLFSKKEDRIDDLNNMKMVRDESILSIIEKINDIRKRMNTVLKPIKKGINVNTIDDMFIISGVIFLNLKVTLDYKDYIEYLLKSEYFGKNVNANLNKSILLKHANLFSCDINKKKIDIKEIVTNISSCFIKIIESYNVQQIYVSSVPLSIKLPQLDELVKLKTSEKKVYDKEDDEFKTPILSIKDQLKYRIENSKGDKKILYNYLLENLDNIDNEMIKLIPEMIIIIARVFGDNFKNEYELCSEEKCKRNIISKYIMMIFDKINKNEIVDITKDDNISLQKYIELNKIRILQNRERGVIAQDYTKGELNREKVKRFSNKIKKTIYDKKNDTSTGSSVNKKRKRMDKIKIDDTDMVRYLLKDINLNKI